jgi:hypothetical protein
MNESKTVVVKTSNLNLLDDTVKVTAFHSFLKDFKQSYIPQGKMRDCKNVKGLMAAMNIGYDPEE